MQRGEEMAPAIDVHDDATKQERATTLPDARSVSEARASIDRRRRRSRLLSTASRLRDKKARDSSNGNSNNNDNNDNNDNNSNNDNNNNDNDNDDNNDNKNSNPTARKDNSNAFLNGLGIGGGKTSFKNSGDDNNGNGNSKNNGNDNNSKGSGNGNSSSSTTTVTTTTSRSSNDSNGAQQLSSVLAGPSVVAETTTTTVAAAITNPATIVVTSTVIAGQQKDSILTNYIPLATAAPVQAGLTTQSQLVGAAATTAPSLSTLVTSVTSASASASASKDSGRKHGNKGSNSSHKNSKSNLSPGAADALISTGSIGSFILVCFLIWLVWRGLRKRKQCKMAAVGELGRSSDRPLAGASRLPARMYKRIVGRIPFLDRRRKAWQSLEDAKTADRGRQEKEGSVIGGLPSTLPPTAAYNEKALGNGMFVPQPTGLGIVGQDTGTGFGGGGGGGAPVYYGGGSLGLGARPPFQQQQLQQLQLQLLQQQPFQQQQRVGGFDGMPTAAFMQHQHTASYSSSSSTAAYPADAMPDATAVSNYSDTLRSRMPDPFYNQSQLARQPSDAYDPARRQVNRLSELSSLSSGFGDEDMIMAVQQQPAQQQPAQQQPVQQRQPSQQPVQVPPSPLLLAPPPPLPAAVLGRFSWKRVTTRMSRDTVYTEASEDQPARFRSVTSWVNQQTGRVRRAQQHEDSTVKTASLADPERRTELSVVGTTTPGIAHPMPDEPRLTMMVDDGQEPRRPETVPAIRMA